MQSLKLSIWNLFADFIKLFKCRFFFDKNSRKSTEKGVQQWDITETNNWERLLIVDDKSLLWCSQPVPKQLITLL